MIDTSNDRFALLPTHGYHTEWTAKWVPPHYSIKRVHMVGHPHLGYHDFKHAVAEGSREAMEAARRLLGTPEFA